MYKKFEELLEPVSLDDVCGVDLEETGELFNLELLTKGKEETQFSEEEPPDWKNVISESINLFKKSKDLWVTSHLITGLFLTDEFKGLSEGMEFLEELLKKYWISIYPAIDEDDEDDKYSFRLNPLQSLFSEKGKLYQFICEHSLSKSKHFKNISIREALDSFSEKDRKKNSELFSSLKDTSDEIIQELHESCKNILESVIRINLFITEKTETENNILDVSKYSNLFENIIKIIEKAVDLEKSEPSTQFNEKAKVGIINEVSTAKLSTAESVGKIKDRQDIKRIFKNICEWYELNEPSSPVPLFIKRAETLVDCSFLEIINEIADGSKSQIKSLFGSSINNSFPIHGESEVLNEEILQDDSCDPEELEGNSADEEFYENDNN
ncbi:MAG: hypothetical protein GY756_14230 [bacterium]|nr:hypothetical protein [bacterium]